MHSVRIRNFPDAAYEKIKESAARNQRTVNEEVLNILRKSFSKDSLTRLENQEKAQKKR